MSVRSARKASHEVVEGARFDEGMHMIASDGFGCLIRRRGGLELREDRRDLDGRHQMRIVADPRSIEEGRDARWMAVLACRMEPSSRRAYAEADQEGWSLAGGLVDLRRIRLEALLCDERGNRLLLIGERTESTSQGERKMAPSKNGSTRERKAGVTPWMSEAMMAFNE